MDKEINTILGVPDILIWTYDFPIRLGASSLIFYIVANVLSFNVLQNDIALKNPLKSYKSFIGWPKH